MLSQKEGSAEQSSMFECCANIDKIHFTNVLYVCVSYGVLYEFSPYPTALVLPVVYTRFILSQPQGLTIVNLMWCELYCPQKVTE